MDLADLRTAVKSNGRFDTTWDTIINQAINQRYAWIWAEHDNWTFRKTTASIGVQAGSQTTTGQPSDVSKVYAILNQYGDRLNPIEDIDEFHNRYYNSVNPTTGPPEAFAVSGGTILVGPTSSETSSAYKIIYDKAFTPLAMDTDVPAIPSEHHMTIVDGASAVVYRMDSDYRWTEFEQAFQQGVSAIESDYLENTEEIGQYGSWEQAQPYHPDAWWMY